MSPCPEVRFNTHLTLNGKMFRISLRTGVPEQTIRYWRSDDFRFKRKEVAWTPSRTSSCIHRSIIRTVFRWSCTIVSYRDLSWRPKCSPTKNCDYFLFLYLIYLRLHRITLCLCDKYRLFLSIYLGRLRTSFPITLIHIVLDNTYFVKIRNSPIHFRISPTPCPK